MPAQTVLDNEAVLVTRMDDAAVPPGGDRPIQHRDALLIDVRDGAGALCHRRGGEARYFPGARGRVDWLGAGELRARAGPAAFGEALLVELRTLPDAPPVTGSTRERPPRSRRGGTAGTHHPRHSSNANVRISRISASHKNVNAS